jgi:hypothetical protein
MFMLLLANMKGAKTKWWLIWSRALDHHVGLTDEEQPRVPNLKVTDANISLLIRTLIVIVNLITCGVIIANAIHHW